MICKKCNSQFPTIYKDVNGKAHNLSSRKYCLICSPFGTHNTQKICGEKDKRAKTNYFSKFEKNPTQKEIFELLILRGYKIEKDGSVYSSTGKKLSPNKNNKGYLQFSFSIMIKGKKKNRPVRVHRFQAYVKYGDAIFEDGIQVRHLNGNKSDNTWDNLELGTQSQNAADIPKEERSGTLKKLNLETVLKIKSDYKNKIGGYKKLSKIYNLHSMTIRDIVKERLNWTKEI
ncbi:MAG TPA: HNH endonuclease signature motif containing protein [Leptospiraceae bacterium]|nr:HNH endonuclease signature motif containing protein [Leptospiraceae bacterium]